MGPAFYDQIEEVRVVPHLGDDHDELIIIFKNEKPALFERTAQKRRIRSVDQSSSTSRSRNAFEGRVMMKEPHDELIELLNKAAALERLRCDHWEKIMDRIRATGNRISLPIELEILSPAETAARFHCDVVTARRIRRRGWIKRTWERYL